MCCAPSGIAASNLEQGATMHHTFGLPPVQNPDHTWHSFINAESAHALRLRQSDVVLIDEISMVNKWALTAIDNMFKDFMQNNLPFGGKVVVVGGDFLQLLPVLEHSDEQMQIDACAIYSPLWTLFHAFKLIQNKRVNNDSREKAQFLEWLMQVGNGTLHRNKNKEITLRENIRVSTNLAYDIYCTTPSASASSSSLSSSSSSSSPYASAPLPSPSPLSLGQLSANLNSLKPRDLMSRVILTTTNAQADSINQTVLSLLDGTPKTYLSLDKFMHSNPNNPILPPSILNNINEGTFPAHSITLKPNAVIILLRNIDIQGGLCNGTRLQIVNTDENLLNCIILTGKHFGKEALIPRMNIPYDKGGIRFTRLQFPVRLCYAMTIHKCQGQTFHRVGIDFTGSIFTHGLLYVALSRCTDPRHIFVYLGSNPTPPHLIQNIVYPEVLLSDLPPPFVMPVSESDNTAD
jgi:hypothetical protein